MTQQMAIDFTPAPAPYQRHSRTSRAAAASIEPKTGTKRAIVLAFLRGRGPAGATDDEMQREIPMGANTQRPRRVELLAARLIRDSGNERNTAGGDAAVVWVATEYAGEGDS